MEDVEENKNYLNESPNTKDKSHNKLIRESGFFLSDREEQSIFHFENCDNGKEHQSSDDGEGKRLKRQMTEDKPEEAPDQDYELIENKSRECEILMQA